MKKILFFLTTVLLFISFIDLQAQAVNDWSFSNPRPSGNTLRWCHMFDANTYYACGYYGNFLKSTDGGTTWTVTALYSPSRLDNKTLYDAHFFNMNTGVVAAYQYIFRTTDAGATWDTCSGVQTQTSSHYKLSFINSTTGFVAGASGRVFKTTNAGVSWTPTGDPQAGTSTKYSCYFINANTGFVGESSADIWRTTNGGDNWTELLYSGGSMYSINFVNSTTGFASGSSTTLLKTTNAGATWAPFSTSGIPSSSLYDIDFHSSTATPKLFQNFEASTWPPTGWTNTGTTTIWSRSTACSGYGTGTASTRAYFYGVSSGAGILQTLTFTPTSAGDPLVFDHAYANYSSPADDSLRILSSTNGGSTWTILSKVRCGDSLQTAPNVSGSFVPTSTQWGTKTYTLPTGTNRLRFYGVTDYGNNLYLDNIQVGNSGSVTNVYVTGNPFAVYKSPISAPSWDSLGFLTSTQPTTSTYYSTSLGGNGDSLFTVGAYGLMNKRNNASNRWNPRPNWTWMTSYCYYGIGVIGSRIMVPTYYSSIWYSTNSGTTWDTMRVNTAASSTLYNIETYGNNVWTCGASGKINKSTDGGVTWTGNISIGGTYSMYGMDFVNANTGWVTGQSGRCYKTTNGGTNWTQQTVTGQTSYIYGVSFANANTGWNCGYGGKVYKTTNGGTNWVAQTSNYTSYLRGIDFVDANTGWMVGYAGTVRKTTNGGTDWDTVHMPSNTSYNDLYNLDFVDEWNGMLVGEYGQTYRTRDGGQNWIYENTGGGTTYGVKMVTSDSGWACGYGGQIFKYAETLTGHNTYTHIVPETYELNQNYPNPFNPTTTIQFALPRAGMVSLKIYDVSGRLVRNLVNNEGLNEGTFKYIFDGNGIASGVYFYSLVVNDELIGTKKMVLIK